MYIFLKTTELNDAEILSICDKLGLVLDEKINIEGENFFTSEVDVEQTEALISFTTAACQHESEHPGQLFIFERIRGLNDTLFPKAGDDLPKTISELKPFSALNVIEAMSIEIRNDSLNGYI